jgi:tetratricopeptide (TPR) repeat protein
MRIKINSLFIALLLTGSLIAQSVDDGKKFLYYERYNSAKDVFNKLLTANPNNVDAAYWLGQVYLGEEDSISAKNLYQKTITANPNAPLLLVGMGQIALMERQASEARNRFETAISLTKGKDFNVINAIGRANVDARMGDAVYAIEKLKTIPENKRTAEMWTTLGDAYRKMTDGANAQLSYQQALAVDPNYARASFMIGRIYQTQGTSQESYYMKYYNEAISKDAKFAPVLNWLYTYFYNRDVNKSREYLDQYIAVSDADSKNCYYQASILYASRQFQQAITKANECITQGGANPYPSLFGLKAFAYEKLGDSANAKTFFETYFQKQNPEKLLSGDYATYGRVLLKFPGNEMKAAQYIEKAIALDTLEDKKIEYITSVANNYLASKNNNEAANWFRRLLTIKKNVTKTDLYNTGYNYYKAANYRSADTIFTMYQQKFPDDILGWQMGAFSKANIDSTGALGLAKGDYEKVIELASKSTDTARAKTQLITAYNYMLAINYKAKDYAAALAWDEKILAIDPTNQSALDNQKALQGALKQPQPKVKVDDNKTKTKTDSTKEKVTPTKTKVNEK